MEKRAKGAEIAGAVIKALLTAYLVTAVILLALAFVLLKFQPDLQKMGAVILACYVVSCFLGGWMCGRKAGKRKFLWGFLTGTLYFALLVLFSGLSERLLPVDPMQAVTSFALCAGSGMAGGMIS